MKVKTIKVPQPVLIWQQSIGTKNAKQMSELYAKDAVLVPTFDKILKGRKLIEGYFVDFLDKEDFKCRITDSQTIMIGNGFSVTNGYYVFHFIDPENPTERDFVFARFTFVLNPQGEIITQHSSEEPTEAIDDE
tara:strand:+ start:671 stop:1072 length:402 start_codon:yes stop_codon:yes gene_type:complete